MSNDLLSSAISSNAVSNQAILEVEYLLEYFEKKPDELKNITLEDLKKYYELLKNISEGKQTLPEDTILISRVEVYLEVLLLEHKIPDTTEEVKKIMSAIMSKS